MIVIVATAAMCGRFFLGAEVRGVTQQWPIKIASTMKAATAPGAAVNLEVYDSLTQPLRGAAFFSKCQEMTGLV